MKRFGLRVGVALWFAFPAAAWACPVCQGGEAANQLAFRVTTVLLSLLPLAMIGGLVYYLRARVRALDAADRSALADLTQQPSSR